MKYIYFITLLILASATLGLAQFDTNLSEGCKSAVTKLIGDNEVNACFPIQSLVPLISFKDEAGLVKAADEICGRPKCSDDLVKKTQNDIKTACQEDLANKNSAAQGLTILINLYSPVRDSMCFKNSTGGYCFIEIHETVEQVLKTAPKDQSPALTFAGAPENLVCTPCSKAIVNTFVNFQKENPDTFKDIEGISPEGISPKDIEAAKAALTGKCGKSFIDGNVGDPKQSPAEFQKQNQNKSDAMSLIANPLSLLALVGSIFLTL